MVGVTFGTVVLVMFLLMGVVLAVAAGWGRRSDTQNEIREEEDGDGPEAPP